jgi:membrane-associated protease RseP (regulator of RpoE activity)
MRFPTSGPLRTNFHLILFVLTFASTAFTWASWGGRAPFGTPLFLQDGIRFATGLLLFLTVHEFGHYFAAKRHRIDVTLPFYVPSPFIGVGTLGAVIKVREAIPSRRALFDLGASGPLAGFVLAIGLAIVALVLLPPLTYLMGLPGHEELITYIQAMGGYPPTPPAGSLAPGSLVLGQTPLFSFLTRDNGHVPPMHELYHFPFLFSAWLALFFTALNLLPVGQLDGGHITYALFGPKWHLRIGRSFLLVLMASGTLGYADEILFAAQPLAPIQTLLAWLFFSALMFVFAQRLTEGSLRSTIIILTGVLTLALIEPRLPFLAETLGYSGWLLWCGLLLFFVRMQHPPVPIWEPLDRKRRLLGYLCIAIFLTCFSIQPLLIVP